MYAFMCSIFPLLNSAVAVIYSQECCSTSEHGYKLKLNANSGKYLRVHVGYLYRIINVRVILDSEKHSTCDYGKHLGISSAWLH